VAALVWWADRRFRLGRGRAFALYAMAYVVGRFWIEALRIDDAQRFFAGDVDFLGSWFHEGIRLNDITSVVVFVGALIYFVVRRGPRERIVVDADGRITVLPDDAAAETEPVGGVAATVDAEDGTATASDVPATDADTAADTDADRSRPSPR
jgi:hypothetical protein